MSPRSFLASLVISIACVNSLANIDMQGGVWLLASKSGTNATVCAALNEIEEEAKNGNFLSASIKTAKLRKEPAVEEYYLSDGEYLPLVLDVMEIYYRFHGKLGIKAAPDAISPVIRHYAKIAKGKGWYAYKHALQLPVLSYGKSGRIKPMVQAQKAVVSYDYRDRFQMIKLVKFAGKYNSERSGIFKFINAITDIDVANDPELELAIINHAGLDNGTRADRLAKWFEKYRSARYDLAKQALDMAWDMISENPKCSGSICESVRKFGLRQFSEDCRLPVLALVRRFSDKAFTDMIRAGKSCPTDRYDASVIKISSIGSNWKSMCDSVSYIWSDEADQRYGGKLSLAKTVETLDLYGKLINELEDPDASLSNINNYSDILEVPDLTGQFYAKVESMYWRGEYEKTRECFEFLIGDDCKDLFAKGASHFFLGRMAKELPLSVMGFSNHDERRRFALNHLLHAHEYPTCCTYISYSYVMAAEVFQEMWLHKTALGLLFIDVPSIDWSVVKTMRHMTAAESCRHLEDNTNMVRHLQEAMRYCKSDSLESERIAERRAYISPELWSYCADKLFNESDRHVSIVEALEEEGSEEWRNQLYGSLTHIWPKMPELPESIATNRALNNNVFGFKRDESIFNQIKEKE